MFGLRLRKQILCLLPDIKFTTTSHSDGPEALLVTIRLAGQWDFVLMYWEILTIPSCKR
jgi:hypothetical protein